MLYNNRKLEADPVAGISYHCILCENDDKDDYTGYSSDEEDEDREDLSAVVTRCVADAQYERVLLLIDSTNVTIVKMDIEPEGKAEGQKWLSSIMRRLGTREWLQTRYIKMAADDAAHLERKADKLCRENRKREADLADGVRRGYILCERNGEYGISGFAPDGGIEVRDDAGAWYTHCMYAVYYERVRGLIDSTNDTITKVDIEAERKAEERKVLTSSMYQRGNPERLRKCMKAIAHNAARLERNAGESQT